MRLSRATTACLLVAPIVTLAVTPAPEARQTTPDAGFEVQQIAPGVHAVLRTDPPGLFPAANSVFIVNADDVVVVDTGGRRARPERSSERWPESRPGRCRTRSTLMARRPHAGQLPSSMRRFPKRSSSLMRASPPVKPSCRHNDRKRLLQMMPVMTQQFRVAVEQKKNNDGLPLSDDERRSHLNDVAAWERFAAESQNVPAVAPAVTVTDKWTVTRGKRVIDVRYLGPGHTAEDLVVYLPQEQIAITGDLVTTPVPMLGAASHLAEYPATLAALATLKPSLLVPGHGGIRKGLDYVTLESRAFTDLTGEVRAAVASGSTLPQLRKTLRTPDLERPSPAIRSS